MNTRLDTVKHAFIPEGALAAYLVEAGLALAVLAGIAEAFAGLGSRWGWWHFTTGFAILRWTVVGGLAAALISLAGGIVLRHGAQRKALLIAASGILVGLVVAAIPWSWMRTAQGVPRIHDITTDTTNPPRFRAILELRKDAANPVEYGGPVVAAQQQAAYPDIKPILLPVSPSTAFETAIRAAKGMGWRIVSGDEQEGRIEATATTFWFGFKDDVVVRIAPVPGGSRVDVRSVSRVGVSDVGTNAKRIHNFLHKVARLTSVDSTYVIPF
jgi:uncharacterized protein (DUF1499 family)